MKKLITVKAQLFYKEDEQLPVYSDGILIKLFDKDILEDDFLGQARLSPEGIFEISFYPEDFSSFDSPGEKHPDLYFNVYKFGQLVFRSKVWNNFDIDRLSVADEAKGRLIDLGKWSISI